MSEAAVKIEQSDSVTPTAVVARLVTDGETRPSERRAIESAPATSSSPIAQIHPLARSHADQLTALRRIQVQAQERIKLGMELFKAAQVQASRQDTLVQEIKGEQEKLRLAMKQEMADSLTVFTDRVGTMENTVEHRIENIEGRIANLCHEWQSFEHRAEELLSRAQVMVDQGRMLLEQAAARGEAITVAPPLPAEGAVLENPQRAVAAMDRPHSEIPAVQSDGIAQIMGEDDLPSMSSVYGQLIRRLREDAA